MQREPIDIVWDMQPMERQPIDIVWDMQPMERQPIDIVWDAPGAGGVVEDNHPGGAE